MERVLCLARGTTEPGRAGPRDQGLRGRGHPRWAGRLPRLSGRPLGDRRPAVPVETGTAHHAGLSCCPDCVPCSLRPPGDCGHGSLAFSSHRTPSPASWTPLSPQRHSLFGSRGRPHTHPSEAGGRRRGGRRSQSQRDQVEPGAATQLQGLGPWKENRGERESQLQAGAAASTPLSCITPQNGRTLALCSPTSRPWTRSRGDVPAVHPPLASQPPAGQGAQPTCPRPHV